MFTIDTISTLKERGILTIYSVLRVVDSLIYLLSLTLIDSDIAATYIFNRD